MPVLQIFLSLRGTTILSRAQPLPDDRGSVLRQKLAVLQGCLRWGAKGHREVNAGVFGANAWAGLAGRGFRLNDKCVRHVDDPNPSSSASAITHPEAASFL